MSRPPLARYSAAVVASVVLALLLHPSASAQSAGGTASVWLTTADGSVLLAPQPGVQFSADSGSNPLTVDVDPSTEFQQMDGFGASFTDSSAWLVYDKLSAAARSQLMTQLFDRTNGIGLSYLRQPMGASDLALSDYTYDDVPARRIRRSRPSRSITIGPTSCRCCSRRSR